MPIGAPGGDVSVWDYYPSTGENLSKVFTIGKNDIAKFWLEPIVALANFEVEQICNVVAKGINHFHWPLLDIDLDID